MEKTVYRSGVDLWLLLVVFGVLFATFGFILFFDFSWSILITGVLLLAFIDLLIFDFKYTILGDRLIVSGCCGLYKSSFDVKEITSVYPTRTRLSSPAASLDRLEVKSGRKAVVISPRKKQEFIDHLLKINRDIVVEK